MKFALFVVLLVLLEVLCRAVFRRTYRAEFPNTSEQELGRFANYSEDIGWEPRPNIQHHDVNHAAPYTDVEGAIQYKINGDGSRVQPVIGKFDHNILVECFGDSSTFCRERLDDETFEHFLEANHGIGPVKNFGVGNYGIDQAYLRAEKRMNGGGVAILMMPASCLSRVGTVYKHYSELGNTWAVKPRFSINGRDLVLIKKPFTEKYNLIKLYCYRNWIRGNDDFSRGFLDSFGTKCGWQPKIFWLLGSWERMATLPLFILRHIPNKRVQKKASQWLTKLRYGYIARVGRKKEDEWAEITARVAAKFCVLARSRGARPLFVLSSQGKFTDTPSEYRRLSERLSHRCALNGVRMFDFGMELISLPEIERQIYRSFSEHLSWQGNAFLAEYLAGLVNSSESSDQSPYTGWP